VSSGVPERSDVPPRLATVEQSQASDSAPQFGDLLERLDDLTTVPVAEHHDRLVEVHDALHAALHGRPRTEGGQATSGADGVDRSRIH
jgi:hypothetical protein